MKRFTFAIVLFLLIGLTYSCNENTAKTNDLKKMGFHGDIGTIIETAYELNSKFGEEQIGNIKRKTVFKFNNDGNKIEESRYNSDGELSSKCKYTYDDKGNMIELFLHDEDLSWKWEYTYDDKGNKIEKNYYHSNGVLLSKSKYTYDKKGILLGINVYDSDGELFLKSKYTYDEKDNIIEERLYNVLEEPMGLTTNEITYR